MGEAKRCRALGLAGVRPIERTRVVLTERYLAGPFIANRHDMLHARAQEREARRIARAEARNTGEGDDASEFSRG